MHHKTSSTNVCRSSLWHYALDCSCGYELIFPFIISRSHHAPHQPHSLALRLVASSSTPRARPSQREVSQERESYAVLIARHLSCILTLPTSRTEPPARQQRVSTCDMTCGAGVSSNGVPSSNDSHCTSPSHAFVQRTACVCTRAPLTRSSPAHRARGRGHAHAISRK